MAMSSDHAFDEHKEHQAGLSMVYDKSKQEWIKLQVELNKPAQDAQQIAGIKGRFAWLEIEWTPVIEQEARKRDGGGITVYLQQVAEEQAKARLEARMKLPGYGVWE